MAAGMGSRYGGLKQMDPIGPNAELIIDYSVYDAIYAGFSRVIFIINQVIKEDFISIIGSKLSKYINVEYAYQELDDLPNNIKLPTNRIKPLGTAHAIYAARKKIDAPFLVINADDFYGRDAYVKMYKWLSKSHNTQTDFSMVGYQLSNTVTEHGYVSRGVCDVRGNRLLDIVERTHIVKKKDDIAWLDSSNDWHRLPSDSIVSMNMWGFSPRLLQEIDHNMETYLSSALKENPLTCEYYLPSVVDKMLKDGRCKVEVLSTDAKWFGVTYSDDKVSVVEAIDDMCKEGIYPHNLWKDV